MSFRLRMSFGRLCRLEKQRHETFGENKSVIQMNQPVSEIYDSKCEITKCDWENIWEIPLPSEDDHYEKYI